MKKRRWTKEEENIMREKYETKTTVKEMMKKLNRSERSIRKKAQYMGLRRWSNTLRVRKLNDYERGFIEGFLDADGYISLSKRRKSSMKPKYKRAPAIVVGFCNTNIDVLKKIRQIIGVDKKFTVKKPKGTYKESYTYVLISFDAINLLKQVSLVVKEETRLKALELHEYVQSIGGHGINQTTIPDEYYMTVQEIIEK